MSMGWMKQVAIRPEQPPRAKGRMASKILVKLFFLG